MNRDVVYLTEAYAKIYGKRKTVNEVVFPELVNKTPHIGRHVLATDAGGTGGQETNLTAVDKKLLLACLENSYATKQPLLVFGPPGNAKSNVITQFSQKTARRKMSPSGEPRIFKHWNKCTQDEQDVLLQNPSKYFVLIDVRTVRYDPTDISGVPVAVPDKIDKNVLRTMKYPWIVFLCKPGADGVLFFDEINQGTRGMLNLLMSVTLDRDFDGVKMSDDIGILAAGNLEGGYSNPLPPALMNRFGAGVLTLSPEEWLEWAKSAIGDDKQEEEKENDVAPIKYNKPVEGQKVDSWITSFVETDLTRYKFVKPVLEGNEPFPSWRAFERLSDKMRYIEQKHEAYRARRIIPDVDMFDEIAHEAALLCGVNWAQDFMIYIGYTSKFTLNEIINDPKQFIYDHLKEPVLDKNKQAKKLNGEDVKALNRGRVYSFITWLVNKSVESFTETVKDPSYRVLIKDSTGNVIEKPHSYTPSEKDLVVGVKSNKIDQKTPDKHTAAFLAFGRAFAQVLEQNDDKAVLKDAVLRTLGGVLPWSQFVLCVGQVCKNTGLVDIAELQGEMKKAKDAITRVEVKPATSQPSAVPAPDLASADKKEEETQLPTGKVASFAASPGTHSVKTKTTSLPVNKTISQKPSQQAGDHGFY